MRDCLLTRRRGGNLKPTTSARTILGRAKQGLVLSISWHEEMSWDHRARVKWPAALLGKTVSVSSILTSVSFHSLLWMDQVILVDAALPNFWLNKITLSTISFSSRRRSRGRSNTVIESSKIEMPSSNGKISSFRTISACKKTWSRNSARLLPFLKTASTPKVEVPR